MALEQRDLSRLLETAIVAARLAGQRALEEINFIKASIKNSDELVTQADKLCQDIIIERIKETYPDAGFIAEEGDGGKLLKQSPRAGSQLWWVIDPIDGTNNFAHRMPLFTTSIAVLYEGTPAVGVIFDPSTEYMFTAAAGSDAQLNNRKITASSEKINRFSSIAIDSHFENETPGWLGEVMKKTRLRNLGSTTLQMAYVASGSLIATVHSRPKLWDIAAGTLIAERAGAVVSDWAGEKIFPVEPDNYQGEPLPTVAANKTIQKELLEMLKR